MVSNSFSRSPSPMSSRPNPNPNPNPNPRSGNQEREEFGVKKSYPFGKSSLNNSAEYARRSSFGRESGGISSRDHEQKENERDANIKPVAARSKSPSVISKGTKNFMSPTISAASKINPSPRKKVLGERNEAIRTSASLSDGKFHFFSTSSLDFDHKTELNPEVKHPPCSTHISFDMAENEVHYSNSKPEKHGFQSLGEVKVEGVEPDLVVLSPEVPLNGAKASESALPLSKMPKTVADHNDDLGIEKAAYSSPCIVAPFDVDPSLPPYDPKNNYLSPRPAFLHYNPNRRIEDDFTSESVSETEISSEEVQSHDSLNDEDVASSAEISSEIDVTESQQVEEMVEAETEPRSRKLTSWKTVAVTLLFVLGLMSISLTFTPGIGNAMFRDETISHINSVSHEVAMLAKDNLNLAIQNAKSLSAYSVDYISQIMSGVREVDRFSSLEFANLSAWHEQEEWSYEIKEFQLESYFEKIEEDDEAFTETQEFYEPEGQSFAQMQVYVEPKDYYSYDSSVQEAEMEEEFGSEEEENSVIEAETFRELQSLQTPESDQTSIGEAEVMDAGDSELNEVEGHPVVENPSLVDEPTDVEVDVKVKVEENAVVESASLVDEPNDAGFEVKEEVGDQFILSYEIQPQEETTTTQLSHVPEIEPQTLTGHELPKNEDDVNADMLGVVSDSFLHEATEGNSRLEEASKKISTPIAAAVTLAVVSLFASFMYLKPKKDTLLADRVIPEKEKYNHATSNMEKLLVHETPLPSSGQVEVDMIGDSCPTEMSTFENSTSVEPTQRGGDEAHSLQKSSKRNNKRESLASASSEYTTGSAYGSFTTYSKIHPKHGDDEVVTPVRRSSRIRSKVTSP
ncbi:hypothetical protein vseg_018492 [Gypsophila vaccaria]